MFPGHGGHGSTARARVLPAGYDGGVRLNEIEAAMAALAKRRPVFHSEADFQHELAWTIHERHPDAGIRLEYPLPLDGPRRVDIWLADGPTAIELKYWKSGGAQDLARYDFWKDVDRIESLIADLWIDTGYVVAVTNDQSIWNKGKPGTADESFRLHEGREIEGTLTWGARAGPGTRKGREQPHDLRGRYRINWRDYSTPMPNDALRYLIIDVGAGLAAR